MQPRPTGTVTFLFTDIEGSTRRWEAHPDLMPAAFARQEAILCGAIAAHGGWAYKQIGDAFQAAFQTAPAALAAAVAAQTALAAEPWPPAFGLLRVRMALHTGTTDERADDYVGPLLNRVARLLSAGHGGQILLTQTTAELLRHRLPAGVVLRDLGERRLKDLIRPEHVYQPVVAGLPGDFPPLKTLDLRPNNLPIQLTSFVGRERELAEVGRLLGAIRLLTLTGAGGSGKTRLALQVAANLVDDFADGVWFVDLAPLADAALVPQAVAAVLNVAEEPGRPLLATLREALRSRRLLLLLDNCEHLIGACAELAEQLLQACPDVRILATSREALTIAGETTYRVPSLALPDPAHLPAVPALSQYEAVRLFIDRALAVQPGFAVTNANAPALAQLCVRLDGIPLAIELAAARVKVLTVEQIAARLDDRFRLLTGGSRTALPRQQTLRALIDWSYDLLTDRERRLLKRLAVFAGGWTLEAAEAVCAGDGVAEYEVLNLLEQLANKSLVIVEELDAEAHYRLLETIRQYAEEKLRVAGEAESVRDQHLAYYLRHAKEVAPQLRGPEQAKWFTRLDHEHDNLRASLTWALIQPDAQPGLQLAAALAYFWYTRGYSIEERTWLQRALAKTESNEYTRTRASALQHLGDTETLLGNLARARLLLEESLIIYQELGEVAEMAVVLSNLATVAFIESDFVRARRMFEEVLVLRRSLGDKGDIALALNNLGEMVQCTGDYTEARRLYQEALLAGQESGNKFRCVMPLHNLGMLAQQEGDDGRAAALLQDSLKLSWERQGLRYLAYSLAGLAGVAGAGRRPQRAARLFGAADALLATIGGRYDPADRIAYERNLPLARQQVDPATWDAAYGAGQAMSAEEAVAYAGRESLDD